MGIITPMAQNFATPVSSGMMFLFGTDHNQILELASTKVARQMATVEREAAGRGFCSRYLQFSVIFSDIILSYEFQDSNFSRGQRPYRTPRPITAHGVCQSGEKQKQKDVIGEDFTWFP